MNFDVYQKSSDLLEKLANSIFDRDPTNPKPFCFSISELHVVEGWLKNILKEVTEQKKMV